MLSPSPDATDGATSATRREAWVTGFDCGAGALLLRASPRRPVTAPLSDRPLGGSRPLPCRADPQRTERRKTMRSRRQDWAAGMRGELNRDRGSRRLSFAITAQRRLTDGRPDGAWTKAGPLGLSDPRYAYLTRSPD